MDPKNIPPRRPTAPVPPPKQDPEDRDWELYLDRDVSKDVPIKFDPGVEKAAYHKCEVVKLCEFLGMDEDEQEPVSPGDEAAEQSKLAKLRMEALAELEERMSQISLAFSFLMDKGDPDVCRILVRNALEYAGKVGYCTEKFPEAMAEIGQHQAKWPIVVTTNKETSKELASTIQSQVKLGVAINHGKEAAKMPDFAGQPIHEFVFKLAVLGCYDTPNGKTETVPWSTMAGALLEMKGHPVARPPSPPFTEATLNMWLDKYVCFLIRDNQDVFKAHPALASSFQNPNNTKWGKIWKDVRKRIFTAAIQHSGICPQPPSGKDLA